MKSLFFGKNINLSKVLILLCTVLLSLMGCSKAHISVQSPSIEKTNGECVVLLHGLARTYRSMRSMQEMLTEGGYHTVNLGYPSTKMNIESVVEMHLPPAVERCKQFNPSALHFVTHSLGGIVVRMALKKGRPANLGRVVMLSPPNKGSTVADNLKDWKLYKWINGPAGQQLSTAANSVPNQLGSVDYPVGIITGDRHAFFDAWFATLIPGIDDGKVSIERTKLEGMTDFLVAPTSHPYIMNDEDVQLETAHFLEHGVFMHQKDSQQPMSGAD